MIGDTAGNNTTDTDTSNAATPTTPKQLQMPTEKATTFSFKDPTEVEGGAKRLETSEIRHAPPKSHQSYSKVDNDIESGYKNVFLNLRSCDIF